MCIVLISTSHPFYPFILVNNRDEFLRRPTARASFWDPPLNHVFGGRDLLRPARGTWLGLTLDGRIACLTNFREDGAQSRTAISRGEMVNAFLAPPSDQVANTEHFVQELIKGEGARGSGGFTLVCGRLGERLAVVSNRMQEEGEVKWVGSRSGETVGLSNAAFGDQTWEKVVKGEKLMEDCIKKLVERGAAKDEIIHELMQLLSVDTMPRWREGQPWEDVVRNLRKSIFIPKLGSSKTSQGEAIVPEHQDREISDAEATSGTYGTQKQTVVLVDAANMVTFVEKTIYDEQGRDISDRADSIRTFDFKIGS